jgi:hypothetical protein
VAYLEQGSRQISFPKAQEKKKKQNLFVFVSWGAEVPSFFVAVRIHTAFYSLHDV